MLGCFWHSSKQIQKQIQSSEGCRGQGEVGGAYPDEWQSEKVFKKQYKPRYYVQNDFLTEYSTINQV